MILADAAALKQLATDYAHPEVGVTAADGAAFGRNWFDRHSASAVETGDDADERALVLAEATALKKSAVDYACPEVGVASAAGVCFGRNYFGRYTAPDTEDADLADERAMILADAAALKQLATDYAHPETGVAAANATLFG